MSMLRAISVGNNPLPLFISMVFGKCAMSMELCFTLKNRSDLIKIKSYFEEMGMERIVTDKSTICRSIIELLH